MTADSQNLRRLLLPLVAVLVGSLCTAAVFISAAFATGACHCTRPITLAFPFASYLWSTVRFESLGGPVMAFQFPVYALLIALRKGRVARLRYALILLIIHVVAVIVVFLVVKG